MNFIRTILLTSVFLIITCQLIAQSFQIRGGVGLSNSGGMFSRNYHYIPAMHFGMNLEYPLKGSRIFETGIYLDQKGNRYYGASESYSRTRTLYLDIPFNLYFRVVSDEKSQLYLFTGSYLGVGLFGKKDFGGEGESGSYRISWGFDSEEDQRKPFDFGFTIGSSIRKKNIKYSISIEQGILNINRPNYTDLFNNIIRLSIAYTPKK